MVNVVTLSTFVFDQCGYFEGRFFSRALGSSRDIVDVYRYA